jgi:hypothetical protein
MGAYYCISLDGTNATSSSFPASQLSYLWSDLFGGSGVLPTYAFAVTAAQLSGATSTTVTLTVTDPLGQSKTVQIPVRFV